MTKQSRYERKIIATCALTAILIYAVSIGLDYVFFYDISFQRMSPATEIAYRLVSLAPLALLCTFIARQLIFQRRARETARHYLDMAGTMIIVLDSKLNVSFVNVQGCKILGLKRHEICGQNWIDSFVSEQDKTSAKSSLLNLLGDSPSPLEYIEYSVKNNQHEHRLVFWHNNLIKDKHSNPTEILCAGEDITERKRIEKALRESEENYRNIVNNSHVGFFRLRISTGRLIESNMRLTEMFGYSAQDMATALTQTTHPFNSELKEKIILPLLIHSDLDFETQIHRQDGTSTWVLVSSRTYSHKDCIEGVVLDISERKDAQSALVEAKRRFETLINNLPGIAYRCLNDPVRTMEYLSRGCTALTGYADYELSGTSSVNYQNLIIEEDKPAIADIIQEAVNEKKNFMAEYRIRTKTGKHKWVVEKGLPIQDHNGRTVAIEGFITDITHRKEAEKRIHSNLAEKEVLLKEIHHRVKNNLQFICSLLRLQSKQAEDPASSKLLTDTYSRILSISLVHEMLYTHNDLSCIDFKKYLDQLVSYCCRIYGHSAQPPRITVQALESVLDVTFAVPCGLIINELVSNCIKHAFPENFNTTAQVTISFTKDPDTNSYILQVQDNGIGFPPNRTIEGEGGLGLNLVCRLTEQINGKLSLDKTQSPGTTFIITFS